MVSSLQVCGFDWDAGNREKCQKHGVSVREIEALFSSASLYVTPDIKHSVDEKRYIAAGTAYGRKLFVAFALRDTSEGQSIRPISARYMHAKEAERYEQEDT
jgi:uncharacterized protein